MHTEGPESPDGHQGHPVAGLVDRLNCQQAPEATDTKGAAHGTDPAGGVLRWRLASMTDRRLGHSQGRFGMTGASGGSAEAEDRHQGVVDTPKLLAG